MALNRCRRRRSTMPRRQAVVCCDLCDDLVRLMKLQLAFRHAGECLSNADVTRFVICICFGLWLVDRREIPREKNFKCIVSVCSIHLLQFAFFSANGTEDVLLAKFSRVRKRTWVRWKLLSLRIGNRLKRRRALVNQWSRRLTLKRFSRDSPTSCRSIAIFSANCKWQFERFLLCFAPLCSLSSCLQNS